MGKYVENLRVHVVSRGTLSPFLKFAVFLLCAGCGKYLHFQLESSVFEGATSVPLTVVVENMAN